MAVFWNVLEIFSENYALWISSPFIRSTYFQWKICSESKMLWKKQKHPSVVNPMPNILCGSFVSRKRSVWAVNYALHLFMSMFCSKWNEKFARSSKVLRQLVFHQVFTCFASLQHEWRGMLIFSESIFINMLLHR